MIELTCNNGVVKAKVEGNIIDIMADFATISLALFEECFRNNKQMAIISLGHFLSEAENIISGKPSKSTTVKMTGITMMNPLDFFGDSDSDNGGDN